MSKDLTLPKETVARLVRDQLPENTRCSKETLNLIIESCVEFIQMVSGEANELSNMNNKKTILPEHVLSALKRLGFDEYVEEVREVYDAHKLESMKSTKTSRKNKTDLSTEEIKEQQRRLFQQAREQQQQLQLVQQQPPEASQGSSSNSTTSPNFLSSSPHTPSQE